MILLFSEKITPRLEYIAHLIFCDILLDEVAFTDNANVFQQSVHPKINYSAQRFKDELFLKAGKFLFSATLDSPSFNTVKTDYGEYFFETSEDSFLPFDPFAASFYLVSRFEEYHAVQRDAHGRFPAEQSILCRLGLLEKPVVNLWARMIAAKITEKFPGQVFPLPQMQFLSTLDVDNAWAYRHKGFFRSVAATVKGNFQGEKLFSGDRIRVLAGKMKDPYDTYDYLQSLFQGKEEHVVLFFLLGDYARFDRQVHWKNKALQAVVRKMSASFSVGIHPSYRSSEKPDLDLLAEEARRLRVITGKEVIRSRQHYLRLEFPVTYRKLQEAGIREDFSMGYADRLGFRAGICTPFFWYDLEREKKTPLRIFPFQVMDVTLQQYLRLSPGEAMHKTNMLMDEVREAGGLFAGVWHNESLSDAGPWTNYRQVFENMNASGFRYAHEQG